MSVGRRRESRPRIQSGIDTLGPSASRRALSARPQAAASNAPIPSGQSSSVVRVTAPILESRGLTKNFGGVRAVRDVSFAVPERVIFSIIGPNGAGKSTIINLLTGLLKPTSGDVSLKGKGISGQSPDRIAAAGMARTFQNGRLFKRLTAGPAALQYNRRHRRILLIYLRRWAVIGSACLAGMAPLTARAATAPVLYVPIIGLEVGFCVAACMAFLILGAYVVLGLER